MQWNCKGKAVSQPRTRWKHKGKVASHRRSAAPCSRPSPPPPARPPGRRASSASAKPLRRNPHTPCTRTRQRQHASSCRTPRRGVLMRGPGGGEREEGRGLASQGCCEGCLSTSMRGVQGGRGRAFLKTRGRKGGPNRGLSLKRAGRVLTWGGGEGIKVTEDPGVGPVLHAALDLPDLVPAR